MQHICIIIWPLSVINDYVSVYYVHCVPIKNIPNVFDCNLKTGDLISILFDTNILDTTGSETTI